MNIRPEQEKDYPEIYALIKTAFETAERSDGTEQDFASALRGPETYVNGLSLVAQRGSTIIGHIMLTQTYVWDGDKKTPILLLAPLSVRLQDRNCGVGAALIKESLARAKDMGQRAVFLLGHKDYYPKFGFELARNYGIGINMELAEEDKDSVMICPLYPGALEGISGVVKI